MKLGTGLKPHHDLRNELYLLKDVLPKEGEIVTAARGATTPAVVRPKEVMHRQYRWYPQGDTLACTGFSLVTYLATARPFNAPLVSGIEWYDRNVKFDRDVLGLFFDGGATTLASMQVGRAMGYWDAFHWAYEFTTALEALAKAPIIAGTWWYPSMFERDAEGIIQMPSVNERPYDGHQYVINGYDPHRELLRIPQTWGLPGEPYGGYWWMPVSLFVRLQREQGDVVQPFEIKVPKGFKVGE